MQRNYKRDQPYGSSIIYSIRLERDGSRYELIVTGNHAFKCLRDGEEGFIYIPSSEVRQGDKVWVDDYAFSMDKSLRTLKRPERKVNK